MKSTTVELTSFSPIVPQTQVCKDKSDNTKKIELDVAKSLLSFSAQSDTEESTNQKYQNSKIEEKSKELLPKANYRLDLPSIFLLFLLYILQGIPLGISQTIPFLLQARKIPYTEQAQFSLAWWPFSLKVIYAPIVDAFYIKSLGRRKSWLIPLQYLIAIFLFVLTFYIEELLDTVNVTAITAVFFVLNFLCATQDITVDGWALTMLRPENVGYAATCNAIGQTLGGVMGYSGFLALNSATFANKYLRDVPEDHGLVSLPQFLFFWGIIFAVTTTCVFIFKKEETEPAHINEQHMDIVASYKNLWKILKLRNMKWLIVFLLTVKIGTAATDAMARLKLVEKGVPKEWVAFFSIPLIPVKLILPLIISKFTVGSNSMGVYINAVPVNILFGLIFPIFIIWTPSFISNETGELPETYYIVLFFLFALQLLPVYTMFVSSMAFAAKVSDPAIGGTYMTLINTLNNVGGMWTATVALWLVDYVGITLSICSDFIHNLLVMKNKTQELKSANISFALNGTDTTGNNALSYEIVNHDSWNSSVVTNLTTQAPDPCQVKIDGYYIESIICVIIGFLWLVWGRPIILRLQKKPLSTWRVFK